jgi:cathepsin D
MPVSGLMGLGFQGISASGSVPFWLNLAQTPNALDAPLMAFHLTRYTNDSNARAVEPGGSFMLGSLNTSLYTGELDYQPVRGHTAGYWTLELSGAWLNVSSALPGIC